MKVEWSQALRDLFPRLSAEEVEAMRSFSGIRKDRLILADFWRSEESGAHWHYKFFDATTGMQSQSVRPIAEHGLWLVMDEFGGRDQWCLTPKKSDVQKTSRLGCIYFIRSGQTGAVKIGWSATSPHVRIHQLQTGNPEQLFLCGVLDGKSIADEAVLHRRLAHLRIRGEWFKPEALLALEVAA